MIYYTKYIENIRRLLQEKDMTQKELAESIGISQVLLSRFLNGERRMPKEILSTTANILGSTPETLLECNTETMEKIYSVSESEWSNIISGIRHICSLEFDENPLIDMVAENFSERDLHKLIERINIKKEINGLGKDKNSYISEKNQNPEQFAPLYNGYFENTSYAEKLRLMQILLIPANQRLEFISRLLQMEEPKMDSKEKKD